MSIESAKRVRTDMEAILQIFGGAVERLDDLVAEMCLSAHGQQELPGIAPATEPEQPCDSCALEQVRLQNELAASQARVEELEQTIREARYALTTPGTEIKYGVPACIGILDAALGIGQERAGLDRPLRADDGTAYCDGGDVAAEGEDAGKGAGAPGED